MRLERLLNLTPMAVERGSDTANATETLPAVRRRIRGQVERNPSGTYRNSSANLVRSTREQTKPGCWVPQRRGSGGAGGRRCLQHPRGVGCDNCV